MSEIELLPHKLCREALDWASFAARTLGIRDVELHLGAESSALTRTSLREASRSACARLSMAARHALPRIA
jgi:hypothetical protein